MRHSKITRSLNSGHHGFSLIELLVAIGILVALIAIALPALVVMRKRGIDTRTRSDLALIGMALEAYKGDFGDYPRFDDDATAVSLNIQRDRGARLLCRALLSPGPAALATGQTAIGFDASDATKGAPDGADGPGFRVRSGGAGKIYPAYIDSSKFRLGNSGIATWDSSYFKDATLLDQNGHTILYYPGYPTAVISGTVGQIAYVAPLAPPGSGNSLPANTPRPFYNSLDNERYGTNLASQYFLDVTQLQYILGDRNEDTVIGTGETATTTLPYLLWTAGIDGVYGFGIDPATMMPMDPKTVEAAGGKNKLKTDDVANFDIPADLRK